MSKTNLKQLQLYEAIKKSDLPTAKSLIESMSPEDIITPIERYRGMTVFERAIYQEDKGFIEKVAKLMIEKNPQIINGVNKNSINDILSDILRIEGSGTVHIEIFKLIINHTGFNSKTLIADYDSIMHCMTSNAVDFCEELNKKFPKIVQESLKIVDKSGNTPFDLALYLALYGSKSTMPNPVIWIFDQINLEEFEHFSKNTMTLGRLINRGYNDIAIKIIEAMPSETLHSFNYHEHSVLYEAISSQRENVKDLLLEKMQFEKFAAGEQQALLTIAAEKGYDNLCLEFSCKLSLDQLDSKTKIALLSKAASSNCEKFSSELVSHMSIDEVKASNALQLASNAKMPNICRKILDKIFPNSQASEQTEFEKLQKEFAEYKKQAEARETELITQREQMQQIAQDEINKLYEELADAYGKNVGRICELPPHVEQIGDPSPDLNIELTGYDVVHDTLGS